MFISKIFILFLIANIGFVVALKPRTSKLNNPVNGKCSEKPSDAKIMPNFKIIPSLIAGALLVANPWDAQALQSGGRSGGSSFRSSSSMRTNSYSSNSATSYRPSSYRSGYISPSPVIIQPMYSPFMPSIFNPFGYSSFGFIPMNLNLLLFGFTAFALYNFLQNRAGGTNFSGLSGDNQGATVAKFQLAVSADWNDKENIMKKLTEVAMKYGSMDDRSSLARFLSEVSLVLLRKQNDWHSVSFEGGMFYGSSQIQSQFQKLAIQERSKFEIESGSQSNFGTIRDSSSTRPTLAVVTLLVAIGGRSTAFTSNSVRSIVDTRACLQGLAADALVEDGDNVLGVELLWTPDNSDMIISERDVIQDYPELLKL